MKDKIDRRETREWHKINAHVSHKIIYKIWDDVGSRAPYLSRHLIMNQIESGLKW